MNLAVELTRSASLDLNDIVDWIARHDSVDNALSVLDEIQAVVQSLSLMPQRGAVPLELRSIGIDRYREVFFKPCRVIHHMRDDRVIVNLIADGRRDMMALLQQADVQFIDTAGNAYINRPPVFIHITGKNNLEALIILKKARPTELLSRKDYWSLTRFLKTLR